MSAVGPASRSALIVQATHVVECMTHAYVREERGRDLKWLTIKMILMQSVAAGSGVAFEALGAGVVL